MRKTHGSCVSRGTCRSERGESRRCRAGCDAHARGSRSTKWDAWCAYPIPPWSCRHWSATRNSKLRQPELRHGGIDGRQRSTLDLLQGLVDEPREATASSVLISARRNCVFWKSSTRCPKARRSRTYFERQGEGQLRGRQVAAAASATRMSFSTPMTCLKPPPSLPPREAIAP